ncbi:MAG: Gfo/Idh/MocA family oxidoreductase, partial [Bacteroidales bacterium]|nr:Gfo/Idh/MocA family oxidoreductase [Bacteroidales bacterium]
TTFLWISGLNRAIIGIPGLGLARKNASVEEIIERIGTAPAAGGKSVIGLKVDPIKQVRVGIIGLGNRGYGMTRNVTALCPDKATIVGICDVRPEKVNRMKKFLDGVGQKPQIYTGSLTVWKEMVQRDDIDLVLVFTNWKEHTPMALYAMRHGKHVATEVPITYTLEEAWELVNTAEETQRNCMMLENVCYGNEELWLLNMAKEGVLGTLTYAEASYIHNLRGMLFGNAYYNQWRIRHHVKRNGNLYPTHGLGPVAHYMDIQRGDRFETLVSMSSKEASLSETSRTVNRDNEFYNRDDFKHGDMNTSLIKTVQGRMIHVYHDVVTPRPYSRKNSLAGTKGYHEGYPSRLSLEEKGHRWLNEDEYNEYRKKYNHPIWDRLKDDIEKYGGHGGMDFVEIFRLIDNLNRGVPLDMDVYDGVAWSAVGPLSEISIELGNVPVKFPDFTRGAWKQKRPLQILVD